MTFETVPGASPLPTPDAAPLVDLWVERTGPRTYTGRSSRGAQVLIGPADTASAFTPGELLKIALAGCAGMSADAALTHHLGADVDVTVQVSGPSDPEEDRYPALTERIVVDLSPLPSPERERLVAVVHRAVELHCTVGRTLAIGATVNLVVGDEL